MLQQQITCDGCEKAIKETERRLEVHITASGGYTEDGSDILAQHAILHFHAEGGCAGRKTLAGVRDKFTEESTLVSGEVEDPPEPEPVEQDEVTPPSDDNILPNEAELTGDEAAER